MNSNLTDPSYELYAAASQVDLVRSRILVPGTLQAVLPLEAASMQLEELAALLKDRSDDVLYLSEDPQAAEFDHAVAIDAHGSAAAQIGRATEDFAAAFSEITYLHRLTSSPRAPEFVEAQDTALRVIQRRLEFTREKLAVAKQGLERAAGRIEEHEPRPTATASRHRSPRAALAMPSIEEAPASVRTGTHHTPNSIPRHGR